MMPWKEKEEDAEKKRRRGSRRRPQGGERGKKVRGMKKIFPRVGRSRKKRRTGGGGENRYLNQGEVSKSRKKTTLKGGTWQATRKEIGRAGARTNAKVKINLPKEEEGKSGIRSAKSHVT